MLTEVDRLEREIRKMTKNGQVDTARWIELRNMIGDELVKMLQQMMTGAEELLNKSSLTEEETQQVDEYMKNAETLIGLIEDFKRCTSSVDD
ncbi:MAG: hypothetical protein KAJ03_04085 [Gammaproteobacteria bacterium]|nr:hypothetical protein [Gammaproteobacteria bacterium]